MHFIVTNWPLAIAFCILCYIISFLVMTRVAAYVGVAPKLTKSLPWITSAAKQDSGLRKVRMPGVGVAAFLMATYMLYLMIIAR
jgi:hypothetical protein